MHKIALFSEQKKSIPLTILMLLPLDIIVQSNTYYTYSVVCCIHFHIHFRILSRSAKCFCSQQNFEVICVKNVSSCLFMVFGYLLKLLLYILQLNHPRQPNTLTLYKYKYRNNNKIISHKTVFVLSIVMLH